MEKEKGHDQTHQALIKTEPYTRSQTCARDTVIHEEQQRQAREVSHDHGCRDRSYMGHARISPFLKLADGYFRALVKDVDVLLKNMPCNFMTNMTAAERESVALLLEQKTNEALQPVLELIQDLRATNVSARAGAGDPAPDDDPGSNHSAGDSSSSSPHSSSYNGPQSTGTSPDPTSTGSPSSSSASKKRKHGPEEPSHSPRKRHRNRRHRKPKSHTSAAPGSLFVPSSTASTASGPPHTRFPDRARSERQPKGSTTSAPSDSPSGPSTSTGSTSPTSSYAPSTNTSSTTSTRSSGDSGTGRGTYRPFNHLEHASSVVLLADGRTWKSILCPVCGGNSHDGQAFVAGVRGMRAHVRRAHREMELLLRLDDGDFVKSCKGRVLAEGDVVVLEETVRGGQRRARWLVGIVQFRD